VAWVRCIGHRHELEAGVAIKVLSDAVASDVERLARFQREAEVLARLNHPTSRRFTDSRKARARPV
jgi:serine/threonine-protein kinase